jgi:hypothetical protein
MSDDNAPIGMFTEQLVSLHEYYLKALDVGFSEEQAIALTLKFLELSYAMAITRNIIDGS